MPDDEWVDLSNAPLIADVRWLDQYRNGKTAATEGDDSWAPRNLAEMEDTPPVQPTLGGLALCYPGKRHVFSGPQESAKTLAAYVIGLSVVRGGASVVLIDFEMGPWDAKTRLRELGATDEELGSVYYIQPDTKATDERIEPLIRLEPDLVLVDAAAGAYDLQELDDNKRGDVERFTRLYVNAFWKAGIATIVLDHVTKNAETRGNYAIGSERKVGGADVHLGFSVVHPIKRGGSGTYKIVTHKDRGGYLKRGKLADFELVSDPDTNAIAWSFVAATEVDDEHPFRPTGLMEKASRFLERCVTLPVSQNTIIQEKLGKKQYVVEALDVLVAEGWMEETAGPNRSRLYDIVTVYREAFDPLISGSSPVSPEFPPGTVDSGSSVRPLPYGGDDGDGLVPKDELSSSQPTLEEDDGIPF